MISTVLGLRVCSSCLLLASLLSCASVSQKTLSRQPAIARTVLGGSAILDDRPRFRALFCGLLRKTEAAPRGEDCDAFLWRLADEKPSTDDPVALGEHAGRAHVMIFGGAFGDCYPPWTTPFAGATADAEKAGFDVDLVPLSGRSGSDRNASVVREKILDVPVGDEPLLLVGYSKGAVDVLEALARYPDIAARVAAFISISGAINGSPLADRYRGLYDDFLRRRKIGSCGPGDGRVLESLEPTRRLNWLSGNPLPRNVRYYSIVSFVSSRRTARILAHTQRILARINPRNDGQLLAEDQLVPGGVLLGFVNADHWAVALRMEDRFPRLAHRRIGKHPFPRSVLLESALLFVRDDLREVAQERPAAAGSRLRLQLH